MKRMKELLAVIMALTMLICTLSVSASAFSESSNTSNQVVQINPNNYPENSRERYVASLALKHNISYEEADIMEQQSSSNISRAYDEAIGYKTINKSGGYFKDNIGTTYVYLGANVKYVYNTASGAPVSIQEVLTPTIYIPGSHGRNFSFSNQTPIVSELSYNRARVSCTSAITYSYSGAQITVGGDIISVTGNVGAMTITTIAKTYAMNITLADLS